jgi:mono/diheme cytochrome c family protein
MRKPVLFAAGVALFSLMLQAQEPATRGQTIYKEQCAGCHGDMLEGQVGPPLTGNDFVAFWGATPGPALTSKIKNTMPQDNPGKLTAQQAADIAAYIVQMGKSPAARPAPPKPATAAAGPELSFPPAGNLAQVMRGILFPSSNIVFTVQTHDPAEKKTVTEGTGGFDWTIWGGNLYPGWELVDYAAVALAESAPLMLTPGRRCENGKPVPVNDPDWIKFTKELAEAGKAAYKASQTRNQETVSDVSNVIADACLHCHEVYRDKRTRGAGILDTSAKALRCTK